MLNKRVENALNSQLNKELFSAYLYMSMAAYFESTNLAGMANWMSVQAQEEMTHAMKFYSFINERNGRVLLWQVNEPPQSWNSPLEAFEAALGHEEYITRSIYDLVDIAQEERDHGTRVFLNWFITEQAEEEANVTKVVEQLKLIKDHPGGLFMMDKELGSRVFVPPAANV